MPRMSIEDLFTLKIAQTWQEVPHGIQRLRVQNMRSWGHRHCRSHAGKPLKKIGKSKKKNSLCYFIFSTDYFFWRENCSLKNFKVCKIIICNYASQIFFLSLLQVHRTEKQFTCHVCKLQFRHKNSLVRHLFQHSGERPFRCQNCESGFTSINRLKEHIKKKHPDTPAAKSIMEPLVAIPNNTSSKTNSSSTNTKFSHLLIFPSWLFPKYSFWPEVKKKWYSRW